jgi:hypothetical protein
MGVGEPILCNPECSGGMPNAEWAVSVNHHPGSAAFREPPPRVDDDSSSFSRFQEVLSIADSGYRTRYPPGAVAPGGPLYLCLPPAHAWPGSRQVEEIT